MKKFIFTLVVFGLASALFAPICSAQNIKVTGNVSEKGTSEPLCCVSILEQGTPNVIMTDFCGQYQIMARKGSSLIASYVGFNTEEEKVAPIVNFVLKEEGFDWGKVGSFFGNVIGGVVGFF